jgi:Clp amino terminal domain, pathogenicity island component
VNPRAPATRCKRAYSTRPSQVFRSPSRPARSSARERVTRSYAGIQMFERFTDGARRVVVAALDDVGALDHRHLGTEHLLLGILRDRDAAGGRAFSSLGVSYDDVRVQVVTLVPRDAHGANEPVVLTARAKKLLELSAREALRHAHKQIGSGDLALALLGMRDSIALRVLNELGVDRNAARARVLEVAPECLEMRSPQIRSLPTVPRLSPATQELLLHVLRVGSSYAARRYLPSRFVRPASTTARLIRDFKAQSAAHSTERTQLAVPASCVLCGTPSPDCGTMYAGAHGALICQHCIEAATSTTARDEPPADG